MSKITVDHLQRIACVYVRQSTPDQLVHNLESQRRQYGLADRAKQLGWTTVEIIDDDLGRSGGGIARPGFERLLAAICDRRVGAGPGPTEPRIAGDDVARLDESITVRMTRPHALAANEREGIGVELVIGQDHEILEVIGIGAGIVVKPVQ